MSLGAFGGTPFSAQVRIWFDCPHGRIFLSQAGPASFILSVPQELSACDGTVTVSVDGEAFDRDVSLLSDLGPDDAEGLIVDRQPLRQR